MTHGASVMQPVMCAQWVHLAIVGVSTPGLLIVWTEFGLKQTVAVQSDTVAIPGYSNVMSIWVSKNYIYPK